jgi:hypothetical protein
MSVSVLPRPGSKFVCGSWCAHQDCIQIRKMASEPCRICENPIGFDALYTGYGDFLRHITCVNALAFKNDQEDLIKKA